MGLPERSRQTACHGVLAMLNNSFVDDPAAEGQVAGTNRPLVRLTHHSQTCGQPPLFRTISIELSGRLCYRQRTSAGVRLTHKGPRTIVGSFPKLRSHSSAANSSWSVVFGPPKKNHPFQLDSVDCRPRPVALLRGQCKSSYECTFTKAWTIEVTCRDGGVAKKTRQKKAAVLFGRKVTDRGNISRPVLPSSSNERSSVVAEVNLRISLIPLPTLTKSDRLRAEGRTTEYVCDASRN